MEWPMEWNSQQPAAMRRVAHGPMGWPPFTCSSFFKSMVLVSTAGGAGTCGYGICKEVRDVHEQVGASTGFGCGGSFGGTGVMGPVQTCV